MIQDSPDHELEFSEQLAKYDESLAAGDAATALDFVLSEALLSDSKQARRFEKMRHCLHLLETYRRSCQIDAIESLSAADLRFAEPGKIGRFLILQRLGSGGFGIVYLAEDPILKRRVALKIPRQETLVTPDLQLRFIRESQIAARLTHRHLVPVFEAGHDESMSYQVTEYCAGGNLAEWLRGRTQASRTGDGQLSKKSDILIRPTQRRLPMRVAVELMLSLAEGVQFAHEQGILHRDLKPANILLHPKGDWKSESRSFDATSVPGENLCTVFQARIADFGLAKIFDSHGDSTISPESACESDLSSDVQRTTLAGTPQYMAPEQISGDTNKIGPRTDIYGLGTILYEILAGVPVFARDSVENLQLQIESAAPRSLRQLRSEVPRDLEAICFKCLEKSVDRRYASAQELVDDLRALQKGESVSARPWPWYEQLAKWTQRRPAVASLLVLLAMLIIGLFSFGAWHLKQLDDANDRLSSTVGDLAIQTENAMLQSRRSEDLEWIAQQREYSVSMIQAAEQFGNGKLSSMSSTLQPFHPAARWISNGSDLSGFAWRYLWNQSQNLRSLNGHSDNIVAASLTSDGTICHSISEDGSVRRWDVHSGHLINAATVQNVQRLVSVQFNRDHSRAILLEEKPDGQGSELICWDVQLSKELHRIPIQTAFRVCISISPDGTWAAFGIMETSTAPCVLTFWDLSTGETRQRIIPSHPTIVAQGINSLAILPLGGTLLLHQNLGRDHTHHQLLKGELVFNLHNSSNGVSALPVDIAWSEISEAEVGTAAGIAVSNDGRQVAVAQSFPAKATVFELKNRVKLCETDIPNSPFAMTFDSFGNLAMTGRFIQPPSNETQAAASPSNPKPAMLPELLLWNLDTNVKHSAGFTIQLDITSLSFHDKSETMIIGITGGGLNLWRKRAIAPCDALKGHQPREAWGVAFSPDGTRLYSVGDDACLRVWDTRKFDEIAVREKHEELASCLAVSPDGRWVATGSYDHKTIIWDATTLQPRFVLEGHTHDIKTLAFSPDSLTLATAARDQLVCLWSVSDGQLIKTFDPDGSVTRGIAFTGSDGFVKADSEGYIVDYGLDRRPQTIRTEGQEVHCLTLAPAGIRWPLSNSDDRTANDEKTSAIHTVGDRELLLVGCKHGRIQLLHLPTKTVWFERSYPGTDIRTVAFSPDGSNFAVAGDDKAIHIWHTSTGQEILTFANLPAAVNQIAFSPDGQMLAAALHDGTIRTWHGPKSDAEKPFR